MANHLMIDLETLDTRPSAVVFQVGLVAFRDVLHGEVNGEVILEERLLHIDILPQIMDGRTVDPETVRWWRTQNPDSWARHPESCIMPHEIFKHVSEMMGENGVGDVWSNSPSFDAVIMRSLGDDLTRRGVSYHEFPSFRDDMDMRTLKKICRRLRIVEFDNTRETTHNALLDCKDQVFDVVEMLRTIRRLIPSGDK